MLRWEQGISIRERKWEKTVRYIWPRWNEEMIAHEMSGGHSNFWKKKGRRNNGLVNRANEGMKGQR